MGAHLLTHLPLDAVEIERWQVVAVGHRFEPIVISADTDEPLDVRIPRRYVVVADWPVDAVTLALRSGKLVPAPALAGPAPDQRLSADLIAANPVERLLLHVRVVGVLYEEVCGVFA